MYWEYGELFGALNVIMKFALNWGMRAMQVEVVVDGPGACGGEVAFVVPRRSRVIGEGG